MISRLVGKTAPRWAGEARLLTGSLLGGADGVLPICEQLGSARSCILARIRDIRCGTGFRLKSSVKYAG